MALTTFFTNQFGQQVAIGTLDLNIIADGGVAGILSPNQSSPAVTVNAGTPAKIDTTITAGKVINFLQAANTDLAIGYFKYLSNKAQFALLDQVVVVLTGGPVMWLMSTGTITPGATVYSDTTAQFVTVTAGGGKARGIALDYVTTGQPCRVLITNPLAIAS